MSGALDPATGAFGFNSEEEADSFDSPHPTRTKAAIAVIRYFMDVFFVMQRSLLFKPD